MKRLGLKALTLFLSLRNFHKNLLHQRVPAYTILPDDCSDIQRNPSENYRWEKYREVACHTCWMTFKTMEGAHDQERYWKSSRTSNATVFIELSQQMSFVVTSPFHFPRYLRARRLKGFQGGDRIANFIMRISSIAYFSIWKGQNWVGAAGSHGRLSGDIWIFPYCTTDRRRRRNARNIISRECLTAPHSPKNRPSDQLTRTMLGDTEFMVFWHRSGDWKRMEWPHFWGRCQSLPQLNETS
jgi:hypothetical protein